MALNRASNSRTLKPPAARPSGRSYAISGTRGSSQSMDKPAPIPSAASAAAVHLWTSPVTSCAVAAPRIAQESWLAIVNPVSANARTQKLWPGYYESLRSAGWAIDFAWTERPGHAAELAAEGVKAGYERILAVGGDGTVNEAVNGIFASGPERAGVEMAILSCGTGGDFVRTLGIPRGIEGILEVLRRGDKRCVDVGRVEFAENSGKQMRYFLNVADAGLGGETVERVNRRSKRWGGKLSFLLGSVQTILSYRNKDMVCHVDGELIAEGLMNSIMIANGRYIGGGMEIAPRADLSDGLFDIVLLGNFSTAKLLYHIPKIYQGTHLSVSGVTMCRGKTVTIESKREVLLDIDGEQPGRLPARFEVLPQALCLWS